MIANAIIPLDEATALNAVSVLHNIVMRLRKELFIEGVDYGKIPGTNDKPVLLLPGMEKLMRGLNAVPIYTEKHIIRDFDKPLFYFEYECRLVDADSGVAIPGGLAIGLATSYESKWRWRKGERTCPNCGKANIRKSKDKPEFYCWAKTDGCGAVFKDTDPAIVNQSVGRIENVDIFDQINTICKIAQKRALSSAIKGAAAVSEFFTVDLEDYNDQIVTVTAEVIEDGKSKASNITNIDVARQMLGSGSVERRAPYETPKTNGSAALDPLPVSAWATKDTIQEFGTKCREATGVEDMSPPDVARLGLDNDTQFFAYKSWNETYPTMQHAIDFIKAAFEAEMTAKVATPATQPVSANEAAIFGASSRDTSNGQDWLDDAPEADF